MESCRRPPKWSRKILHLERKLVHADHWEAALFCIAQMK